MSRMRAYHGLAMPARNETNRTIELWLWDLRVPATGRWRRTTWRMTAQEALERHGPEARRVDWTRELRRVVVDADSTGSFLRAVPTTNLSAGQPHSVQER